MSDSEHTIVFITVVTVLYQMLSVVLGPVAYVFTGSFDPLLIGACAGTALYLVWAMIESSVPAWTNAVFSVSILVLMVVGVYFGYVGHPFATGYTMSLAVPYMAAIVSLITVDSQVEGDGEWKYDVDDLPDQP